MGTNMQVALGVAAVVLVFAPAFILIIASVKVIRTMGGLSAVLIAIGAFLLTIVSLEFLYSYVVALMFGPEKLAAYTIFAFYLFKGLKYFALLLIGIGLIRFTNRAKSMTEGSQAKASDLSLQER